MGEPAVQDVPAFDELRRQWSAVWGSTGRYVDVQFARFVDPFIPAWQTWTGDSVIAKTLRRWLPLCAVIVLCSWYFAEFGWLSWQRHELFGSFDYDLGMYDQGIWRLSHGAGFMTVRGMHVFGHHANIGYLLFVPFYWIGIGGPHFLNIMNTLGVVAVSWPLYLLGRRHLNSGWAGLFLVVAYLFHFSPQWKINETFHAESMAAPALMAAFYFLTTKQWRWYWLSLFGAIIWKEDVAIFIAAMSLSVLVISKNWRQALKTLAFGAAWFVVATMVFMPAFRDSGAVYDNLFGTLGDSATEVLTNSLKDPDPLRQALDEHRATEGAEALAAPYSYLGVLAPDVMLAGAPQHVISYATAQSFTWDLRWHYLYFPFLSVLMATAWAIVRIKRAWIAWPLLVIMVLGVYSTFETFDTSVIADEQLQAGIGPWTTASNVGYWPLYAPPDDEALKAALKLIPDDAVVTAPYFLVPHLSHRDYIYTFPNPWRGQNYTLAPGQSLPDQNTVEYVVLRTTGLNDPDRLLYQAVANSGQFSEIFRQDGVVVLHRERSGPPVAQPLVAPDGQSG